MILIKQVIVPIFKLFIHNLIYKFFMHNLIFFNILILILQKKSLLFYLIAINSVFRQII